MASAALTTSTQQALAKSSKTLAQGLFWGGLMLGLFVWWLTKDQPDAALWLRLTILGLGAFSLLAGTWQALTVAQSTSSAETGQAVLLRQRRVIGFFLLLGGCVLLVLAGYLGSNLGLRGFSESVGLALFALVPLAAGSHYVQPFRDPTTSPGALSNLSQRAKLLLPILALVGGSCLVAFIWLGFRTLERPLDYFPELGTLLFESFLCLACVLWLLFSSPEERTSFSLRILVLIWGGCTGLIIAGMALMRAILWRQDVFLGGLAAWQGEQGWKFWLCAYVEVIGLVLMFGSLLLARTDVRSQPVLRQVLYGYNSLVTGLLLLAFLGVLNVVVYAMFPMTLEWSKVRGVTSLSQSSKTFLAGLKKPTSIYVLMPEQHSVFKDLQALLGNMQTQTEQLQVKYLSPDRNFQEYRTLAERFPEIIPTLANPEAGRGMLVLYGGLPKDEKEKVPHVFIPEKRIYEVSGGFHGGGGEKATRTFRGEVELIKELSFLVGGQKKQKVYFLQGDGELNIAKTEPFLRQQLNKEMSLFGASVLVDRLKKDNYEVQGLSFEDKDKNAKDDILYVQETGKDRRKDVPDDAFAVVILGASQELSQEALSALTRFMDRGGRMIVTLEMVLERSGDKLRNSGMAEFLKRYGVDTGDDYIMRVVKRSDDDPRYVFCFTPENGGTLAQQFKDVRFPLDTVRSVRPIEKSDRYKAEVLLQAEMIDNNMPNWKDSSIKGLKNPIEYLQELARENLLRQKVTRDPQSVAVTVEEGKKPRMVVFGDTEFLMNPFLSRSPMAREYYSIFVSSLEWMTERESAITSGLKPKETTTFALPATTNENRLVFLPGWLMILGIFGLGCGIWIVRRR